MKKICVYLAAVLVLAAFGMTVLAHAGDLTSVPAVTGAGETVPEVSTEYEVPVPFEPVTDALQLSAESLKIKYLDSAKLTANADVTWKSDNERIVKVASDGTVTAVGRGTAHVTATTEDGRSATCTVTVYYTFLQWIIRIVFFGWIWYK